MKQLKKIIILCALLFLSSCGQDNTLNNKKMLEDYDYFWNTIDNYYAHYGVANRELDIDDEELRKMHRKTIEKGVDEKTFEQIIETCIDQFSGIGHMQSFADKEHVLSNIAVYDNLKESSPHCAYLAEIMMQDEVLNHYQISKEEIELKKEELKSEEIKEDVDVEGLEIKELQDNIAYIKIENFDSSNKKKGVEKILSFYETIKAVPNLIIDIRGNGGGSSSYAIDAFISPNIEKDIIYNNYYLGAKNTVKHPYYKIQDLKKERQIPDHLKTNLNEKDYENSKGLYFDENTIKSKNNEKAYAGKIYLLVDENVYSSSEFFASSMKRFDLATLVGTNTNGDGVGIDPCVFSLPNSGILYRFSMLNGLNVDGSSNEEIGTKPDVEIGLYDDALEVCLKIINK